MKSDGPPRRFRCFLHRFEGLNDRLNLLVVQLNGLCQARKLLDQLARRGHQASEPDEGPHDLDIDPHCNGRTEDAGEMATPCSVKAQGR